MENNEKLFILSVINLCRLEYKHSKRIPRAIQQIYEECVTLADNSGMELDEYIKTKLAIK